MQIPNPNVMFELGFAVRSLGWDRVICICNEEYGDVETQPFDISKHRIITYRKKMVKRNQLNHYFLYAFSMILYQTTTTLLLKEINLITRNMILIFFIK